VVLLVLLLAVTHHRIALENVCLDVSVLVLCFEGLMAVVSPAINALVLRLLQPVKVMDSFVVVLLASPAPGALHAWMTHVTIAILPEVAVIVAAFANAILRLLQPVRVKDVSAVVLRLLHAPRARRAWMIQLTLVIL
jgi:hypothetical protein